MNASVIIEALGGTYRVAELCEVRPPSVSDWKKHGIPRARMMFLKIARPEVFKALDEGMRAQETNSRSATKKSVT